MTKLFNVIIFLGIILLSIILFMFENQYTILKLDYEDFKNDVAEALKDMKYDLIDLKASKGTVTEEK
jgi:hypothetical protein